MPARRHLTWTEIKEFGGLWTAGAQTLMPADKSQVMAGCHPQPGGGLRAFHKVTNTIPNDGLSTPVDDYAVGFGVDLRGEILSANEAGVALLLVTVDGTHRLSLPGAGSYATSPHSTAHNVDPAGDPNILVKVHPTDETPAAAQVLASTLDPVNFTGYELRYQAGSTGRIELLWGTGAAIETVASTAAPAILGPLWISVLLDVDNGAAGHDVYFDESSDGETFVPVGTYPVVTAGVTSVANPTLDLNLGRRPDGTLPFTGHFHNYYYENTDTGDVIDLDFAAVDFDATSVTDPFGNVFTLVGAAAVVESAEPAMFKDWRTWRWNTDDGATLWATTDTGGVDSLFTTPPAAQPQFAMMFVTDATPLYDGTHRIFIGVSEMGGMLHFDPTDGSWTLVDNGLITSGQGMVEHQSRLVSGHGDTVQFSAPGTDEFPEAATANPAAGFIRPNPSGARSVSGTKIYEGAYIVWMLSIPPGDFLIATRDGRIYNVQGDLADPAGLRELARVGTLVPHEPVNSPHGVFFIQANVGVMEFTLDGSASNVAHDLQPNIWTLRSPKIGLGQLATSGRFIFAPNQHDDVKHRNGALVYDVESKAWFTSTHEDEHRIRNPRMMVQSPDYRNVGVWVVSGESPGAFAPGTEYAFNIRTGNSNNVEDSTPEFRNSIWEYETAPLREPEGRYLDMRQVRIPVYAFDAASTLTVTVGDTMTVFNLAAGRSVIQFNCRERDEFLSVHLYAEAGSLTVEAPMIEAIQMGWKSGPLL